MTKPILTVVIPTFDRPDHLQNLVRQLVSQTEERWKLLIIDNHSARDVRELALSGVEVVRNPANIGVAGNVPRCFELCETEWIWLIGDDDVVEPDAIERVLKKIETYPDAAIINFGSPGKTDARREPVIFQGLDAFLAGCDSIGYTIWMSGNIHARRFYWPHIGLAYRFASTRCAHYVLLIMALLSGGSLIQLADTVCRQSRDTSDDAGNHGEIVGGVISLVDLPMAKRQRRTFARLLQHGFCNLPVDAIRCSFHMSDAAERDEALYLFASRWLHFAIARGSLPFLLHVLFYRSLLGWSLGRMLLRFAADLKARVTGQPLYVGPTVSRFYRV